MTTSISGSPAIFTGNPYRRAPGELWRGMGSASMVNTGGGGTGGPSAKASYRRSAHVFPVPFRRLIPVIPTFIAGTSAVDLDLDSDFNVNVAFEYPFEYKQTGLDLGKRKAATFDGGKKTGRYKASVGPFPAIVGDVFDFGTVIPAYTPVGAHMVWEWDGANRAGFPTAAAVRSSIFPNSAAYWERCGTSNVSLIDQDATMTLADFSAVRYGTTVPTSRPSIMFLVDCGPGTPSVLLVGDSINERVAEGAGGRDAEGFGDSLRGSAEGHSSWAQRYIGKYCYGTGYINLSKASDRISYEIGGNNIRRRALAALMNPSHILMVKGTNDLATNAATIAVNWNTLKEQYRSSIGKAVPVYGCTLCPAGSSTDDFKTVANQTPLPNWGTDKNHGLFNDMMRAKTTFEYDGYFDFSEWTDAEGKVNSGKWKVDPNGVIPRLHNGDGGHPSAYGNEFAARAAFVRHGNPFKLAA